MKKLWRNLANQPDSLPTCLLLVLIALLLYWRGLAAGYYGDDFAFIQLPPRGLAYWLTNPNPTGTFYRPLEAATLGLVQSWAGWSGVPLHLIQVSLHGTLAWLVGIATFQLGFSRWQSWLASGWMLCSQIAVMPVLGMDTLSQVAAVTFALAGCLLFWLSPHRASWYGLAVLCWGLALLWKESALGWLAAFTLVGWLLPAKNISHWAKIGLFWAVAGIFLLVRGIILKQNALGNQDAYVLELSIQTIINCISLLFAGILPISTVSIWRAYLASDWRILTLAIGSAGVVGTLSLWGWTKIGIFAFGRMKILLGLVTLVLCACFPMAFLPHVSELYVYSCLPFLAMLVGIGLGKLSGKAVYALLLVMFLAQITSIQAKSVLAVENSRRASALLAQLHLLAQEIPANRSVFLQANEQPAYSVFVMPGVSVLEIGLARIPALIQRPDIELKWAESAPPAGQFWLGLDEKGVLVFLQKGK